MARRRLHHPLDGRRLSSSGMRGSDERWGSYFPASTLRSEFDGSPAMADPGMANAVLAELPEEFAALIGHRSAASLARRRTPLAGPNSNRGAAVAERRARDGLAVRRRNLGQAMYRPAAG
jgi:hypothetical protein